MILFLYLSPLPFQIMNSKVSLSDILCHSTSKDQLERKEDESSMTEKSNKVRKKSSNVLKATKPSAFVSSSRVKSGKVKIMDQLESLSKKIKEKKIMIDRLVDNEERTSISKTENLYSEISDKQERTSSSNTNQHLEISDTQVPAHDSDIDKEAGLKISAESDGQHLVMSGSESSLIASQKHIQVDPKEGNTEKENVQSDDSLDSNNSKFKCKDCLKEFKQLQRLQRHQLQKKCKIPASKCSVCQKEMKNPKSLYMYIKRKHRQSVFKCNNCPKTYPTEYGLLNH